MGYKDFNKTQTFKDDVIVVGNISASEPSLSGQLTTKNYVDTIIAVSGGGGSTDFTAISGYSEEESQFFTNISGDIQWEEAIDGDLIYASKDDLNYVSGVVDTILEGSSVLIEIGQSAGALTIDLSGDSSYEYILSGDSSFTAINAEDGMVKYATSILSASFVGSVSASFDPTWYWAGERPASNAVLITAGNMIQLVLNSSGTKIIAAQAPLV